MSMLPQDYVLHHTSMQERNGVKARVSITGEDVEICKNELCMDCRLQAIIDCKGSATKYKKRRSCFISC